MSWNKNPTSMYSRSFACARQKLRTPPQDAMAASQLDQILLQLMCPWDRGPMISPQLAAQKKSWPIMARQPRDSNPWQPMSQRALCSAPPCRAYSFPTTDAFASPPVSCCGCNSNLSSPKTLSQLSGFCIFFAQSDFTISAPSAALLRQKP